MSMKGGMAYGKVKSVLTVRKGKFLLLPLMMETLILSGMNGRKITAAVLFNSVLDM